MVELDGEDHFWEPAIEKDWMQENYLKSIGIQMMRFYTKWAFEGFAWVLEKLQRCLTTPVRTEYSSGRV